MAKILRKPVKLHNKVIVIQSRSSSNSNRVKELPKYMRKNTRKAT